MPLLDLPLVATTTTLRDAFDRLVAEKRSALAIEHDELVAVITVQQIVSAAKQGATTVKELQPTHFPKVQKRRSSQVALPYMVTFAVSNPMRLAWFRGPDACECDNPDTPHGPYWPADDGKECQELGCGHRVRCPKQV